MTSDSSAADGHAPEIQGRLLLLSNRLPITIKRSDDGSYTFSMSSGGLVTGLSGLSKTTSFQWYGWPGLEVPDNEVDGMKQRLKDEYGAHPVFVDDELADRHYNGFSSTFTPRFLETGRRCINRCPVAKIQFSGRSSTIILAKSHLTSLLGPRTRKSTVFLPKPSSRMSRMAI